MPVTATRAAPAATELLHAGDLAGYLIGLGLLPAEVVVRGDLTITDVSSRNRDHVVASRTGPSLFVKQAQGDADRARLRYEAGRYAALGRQLSAVLPRMRSWDDERAVLVLDAAGAGDVFATRAAVAGPQAPHVAAGMGRALAALHGLPPPAGENDDVPGVLVLGRPSPEVFRDTTSAALDVIRIVQQDEDLAGGLDGLRDTYRATTLVHHDAKWDNFLAGPDADGWRVWLIDWELAGLGDPAWDVGSVLGGYLSDWLFSIPPGSGPDLGRLATSARHPLGEMRTAIAAFWDTYAAAQPAPKRDLLDRATRFCAARLVQTAYEASQLAAELADAAVLHLQVAANMLRRPAVAADALLGLR